MPAHLTTRRKLALVAVAAAAVLAIVWIVTRGANPPAEPEPLEIGPDTTRISGPLAADGLPDYIAVLNDVDVPAPEDNAVIPILRAFGTRVLVGDPDQVLTLLGAPDDLPEAGPYFEPDFDAPYHPDSDTGPPREPEEEAGRIQWIADNATTIAEVMAATRRPRLWTPVVRTEAAPDVPAVIESALPVEALQQASHLLETHADVARERGDHDAALAGAQALFRLSSIVEQVPRLVFRLTALSIRGRGLSLLRSLLAARAAPEARAQGALVQTVLQDVAALRLPPDPRDVVDVSERYFALDMLLRRLPQQLGREEPGAAGFGVNAALREINRRIDEALPLLEDLDGERLDALRALVEAGRARMQALPGELGGALAPIRQLIAPMSPERGGQILGDMLGVGVIAVLPFTVERIRNSEQHRHAVLIAAALRLHALRHGAFPAALDELVPETLAALPAHPLLPDQARYERTEDGCTIDEGEDWVIELTR